MQDILPDPILYILSIHVWITGLGAKWRKRISWTLRLKIYGWTRYAGLFTWPHPVYPVHPCL